MGPQKASLQPACQAAQKPFYLAPLSRRANLEEPSLLLNRTRSCIVTHVQRLREPIASSGLAAPDEVDRVIALSDHPHPQLMSPMTVAAWGRRPPEMAAV
jgi:hypothetical protein